MCVEEEAVKDFFIFIFFNGGFVTEKNTRRVIAALDFKYLHRKDRYENQNKHKLIYIKKKALFFSRTCHCSQTMASLSITPLTRAVSLKIFYLLRKLHSTVLYYMMHHMSIHFVNCNII